MASVKGMWEMRMPPEFVSDLIGQLSTYMHFATSDEVYLYTKGIIRPIRGGLGS